LRLLLLRHGDALPAATDDHSRPLSLSGEEQARRAGEFLTRVHTAIDVLLCSPLLRAQQTGRIVSGIVSPGKTETTEHLVPSSNPRNLINMLNQVEGNVILCVGHEPHISVLISLLISGSRNARVMMEKGELACVEVTPPIAPGKGILCWLVPNEKLSPTGGKTGAH